MPALRIHFDNGQNITIPSGQFQSVDHFHAVLQGGFHPWGETHIYGVHAVNLAASIGVLVATTGAIGPTAVFHETCFRREAVTLVEARAGTPVASLPIVPLPLPLV